MIEATFGPCSLGVQFFQGTQERRLVERIYRFDGWYVGVKRHGNGMCRLWADTCMTVFVGQEMVNFPAPQKPQDITPVWHYSFFYYSRGL